MDRTIENLFVKVGLSGYVYGAEAEQELCRVEFLFLGNNLLDLHLAHLPVVKHLIQIVGEEAEHGEDDYE